MTTSRFERFSERARLVLTSAQEEARHLNHSYIGTEHILLSLIREEDGMAAKALTNLGISLPKMRSALEFIMTRGQGEPAVGELPLSPSATRAIELAIAEARHLGHNSIGTEHLLLGLLQEGEGIAAGVVASFAITLEQPRAEIMAMEISPQGATKHSKDLVEGTNQLNRQKVKALDKKYDVFIAHASEDKNFVTPLALCLRRRGLEVWYDDFVLKLGDSLRRMIDRGLAQSQYGVVILSHNFFNKHWPQKELDALASREQLGKKVILPVWHTINKEEVAAYSPTLADIVAAKSSEGAETIAKKIIEVIYDKA